MTIGRQYTIENINIKNLMKWIARLPAEKMDRIDNINFIYLYMMQTTELFQDVSLPPQHLKI